MTVFTYPTVEQVLFIHMRLTVANAELEQFTLQVARSELSIGQVTAWLCSHCVALSTRP